MDLAQLIVALQNATEPARSLDDHIAMVMGYRKSTEAANPGLKTIWLKPDGSPGEVAQYTRLIDSAFELVAFVAPDNVGAFSWEQGKGSAKLNDGHVVQAANPALALCVAALQILWQSQKRSL